MWRLTGTAGEKEKMNRTKLQSYIEETYGAKGECLWAKYPTYMVFRHNSNRKWFAAIMEIPREKLGLSGGGDIWVVNVKCDTRLIGSFRQEQGVFPAYHMSKAHWLSVALDGTVAEDQIRFLLDMSYALTKGR